MNEMDKYLVGADEHSLITADGLGNYDIVCHNYRHLNYKYYLKREDEVTLGQLDNLFVDNEMFEINYQLTGVKNGKYKIKMYSMSPDNGSVLEEWRNMGMDRELIRQEIDYLKRICTPRIYIRECEVTQSVLNFEVHLKPHEVMGMEIIYLYE